MKLHLTPLKTAAACVLAPCICALADAVVYTVTTSGANSTNLLSEAVVEIDDNGVISSANFADVTFAANSVFRKRGEGFLKSCSAMGAFTGEVRIEEGALIIDNPGQLGPSVEKSTTDPLVVVSNGASLVVAYDGEDRNVLRFCGGLRIAGTGYQGLGAVRNEGSGRVKYLFSSTVTLDGDATMVNASTAQAADDRQWGTDIKKTINLNTFTLTLSGYRFWSYGASFTNPGHVVVSGDGCLQLQSIAAWPGGDASNTLKIESGGLLEFYMDAAQISTSWTLVLEDGARLRSLSGSTGGSVNTCYWSGPVLLNGRVLVDNGGSTRGFALLGAVSGTGGFDLVSGRMELVSPDSSFEGGVHGYAASGYFPSLGLWSGTALPSPFASTNSSLSLSASAMYALPALSFHAKSDKTLSVAGGTGGTAASLEKTGPGVLELTAPLAVTGGVTLAGGTLRLSSEMSQYSPAPGLIESHLVAGTSSGYNQLLDDWYTSGTVMNTNAIVPFVKAATVYHGDDNLADKYAFKRYKGYIWNRSNENAAWTFALSMQMSCQLFIDNAETPVISYADSSWKSKIPVLHTRVVTPGAHYFDLRMANTSYQKAGPRTVDDKPNVVNWPNNYGFVIDFEGRGTYDGDNYSIPSNNVLGVLPGGDGSLFTVDARDRDDVTGDDYTRASFPVLAATPGTTLDLNAAGCTFTVQELSGVTSVANGSLHVAKKWTLSNEALAAGIPLSCDAKITFGDGWTLSVPDLADVHGKSEIVLAAAANGGLALPAVFDRGTDTTHKWRLELSADGTQLKMVRSGFMMSFR